MNSQPGQQPKFLLIQAPIWDVATPPYSLAYVAGIIRSAGWDCRVLDLNILLYRQANAADQPAWGDLEFYRRTEAEAAAFYGKYAPVLERIFAEAFGRETFELAGFSVNQQSRYFSIWAAKLLSDLAPSLPVIFGGSECFSGEFGLRFLSRSDYRPDLILRGEAEIALPAFLREYARTRSCETRLAGFGYEKQGELVDTGEPPLPDLQDGVTADYSHFDFKHYQDPGQFSTFFTRGCINQCAFCNERSHFKRFRVRKPQSVIAEIKGALPQAAKTGTAPVARFNDSIFNGSLKAVGELCDLMIREQFGMVWGIQASFSRKIPRPLWEKMGAAGCRYCFWGFENASQPVLDAMQKQFDLETVEEVLADAASQGIHSYLPLIVGFPGETPDDILNNIRFIRSHRNMPYVHFIYVSPIQVKPDSRLHRQAAEYGIQGLDEFEWYTNDGKNVRATRVFRVFLIANAMDNPDWNPEKTARLELLPHLDFNQFALAYELAWCLCRFGAEAGDETGAQEFISRWQEAPLGMKMPEYAEHWRPPAVPPILGLDNWYLMDKNNRNAKARIIGRLFEYLGKI
ncbi:MAG: radical SAM protein [candidate division FCPU426 bacterium]